MARAPATSAAGAVEAGRAELAAGRWRAARERFEQALAAGETAEALEGLGWAAWWLDDADTVFRARGRAFRLHRGAGDRVGAARTATWIAADELDFHGALAVAGGWRDRARRLLAGVAPAAEHGWLAFHDGYAALATGDVEQAAELGARTAALGRELAEPDLEMLGLALEGSTLVRRARVAEGMRLLDEAGAVALEGEATIPISSAWTCCFLVSACTAVRDFGRAAEWCDRIAAFAERFGSRYMLAFCRAEYGAVDLWRGRWTEAGALLEAAHEDYARTRPAYAGAPLAALAELRRRQGRAREAADLAARAGASTAARLVDARLALDGGEPARADALLERLLRGLSEPRALDRVPALELLVAARVARGSPAGARQALEELVEVACAVGTAPLRAAADLAAGVVAAAAGDHASARRLLEDAVDGFAAAGAPFETARARRELAATLAALGLEVEARREEAAAREELRRLGAARAGRGGLLTPREREVLALLAEGLTNQQIASRLVVSEHTVHRHVTNILRKLEVPSRAAAAAHAVRDGLLER